MVIDVHTHIYPDAIAEKAARSIGAFYGIPMKYDGRLSTLLGVERAAGADHVVICSAATTARQTSSINDYLAGVIREGGGYLSGIGAMHQDTPDKGREVERMRGLGLLGVKVHPDIQGVAMNDRRFDDLYAALSEFGMVFLCHTGDTRYQYSNPPQFLDVLARFPKLKVIGAHLGYWSNWTEGAKELAGRENVWVDCSSSLYAISPEEARRVIRAYGADRVMFGSDFPMWDAGEERRRLEALRLTDEEMDKILGGTARQLLGIAR